MSATHSGPTRRLSKLRLTIALAVICAVVAAGFINVRDWAVSRDVVSAEPWFAGYVDVTATPHHEFENPAGESSSQVMLSFIVAAADAPCTPTWGGAYTLAAAATDLDLDRRIARLEQQGGAIGISFGGLLNDELATSCTDARSLTRAYETVIERYGASTIDLDIEGENLSDAEAGERRAQAIAGVQQSRRAAGEDLAVWLTLPAATFGLTEDGTTFVAQMLAAGVDIAGVNVMTMNFGDSLDDGETMADASARALRETHRQLGILYSQADTPLSSATLWRKLGATPMIGQNDVATEVFTLEDATALNAFSLEQGLGRLSMWSLNRDTECGPNYVHLTRVSDSCSGVEQGTTRFADLLAADFDGALESSAGAITLAEPQDGEIVDDPETSPYPIWNETASYPAGTKVVWKQAVYQTKWWTSGDAPDAPVLSSFETPWTLLGPVLEGEKPVDQPTIPAGMYPEWDGMAVFEKGDRVIFDGLAYEAKWWTTADSPEKYSADPGGAAWRPLTVEEIEEAVAAE
ncbi:glycosyl hydrolase family 18 [Salinibacterium sp. GXW1014]|uniref:glycosyl hydrolase family 18 n=1 Tax=Salinibacterium sp. GXW1014 TaxID=3377838 RepID=UPI00383B941A